MRNTYSQQGVQELHNFVSSVRTSVTQMNQQTVRYRNISTDHIPSYVFEKFCGKVPQKERIKKKKQA